MRFKCKFNLINLKIILKCSICVREDISASPPPGARGSPSRVARLNNRKDLRIRLEQQSGGGAGSSPGSPGGSSCGSSRGTSTACGGTCYSRSCNASPGTGSPNAPSSPRSSSSGSPKARSSAGSAGGQQQQQGRKLSLMAEELEGMRHVYLSPPPSPKLFFNINPQSTWEAFK